MRVLRQQHQRIEDRLQRVGRNDGAVVDDHGCHGGRAAPDAGADSQCGRRSDIRAGQGRAGHGDRGQRATQVMPEDRQERVARARGVLHERGDRLGDRLVQAFIETNDVVPHGTKFRRDLVQ